MVQFFARAASAAGVLGSMERLFSAAVESCPADEGQAASQPEPAILKGACFRRSQLLAMLMNMPQQDLDYLSLCRGEWSSKGRAAPFHVCSSDTPNAIVRCDCTRLRL